MQTEPGPRRHAQTESEFLAAYDPAGYPPFAVTVDLALFTIRSGLLSVLLVQRGDHPFRGYWALPGGFMRGDESAADAARRELAEETGAASSGVHAHLEQLRTYTEPGRDPRMRVVSVAHVAFAPDLPDPVAGTDAAAARWWPVADLTGAEPVPLAFDHARILDDALDRIGWKLEYTTLAAAFVAEPFTIAELRRVYAAVWGEAPDLANFRRKVLGTPGFVTEDRTSPVPAAGPAGGRPPQLYRRGPATALHPPLLRPGTDVSPKLRQPAGESGASGVGLATPRSSDWAVTIFWDEITRYRCVCRFFTPTG